nr:MAG TPA: hypothetical protein [Caudoviricetes sp.]
MQKTSSSIEFIPPFAIPNSLNRLSLNRCCLLRQRIRQTKISTRQKRINRRRRIPNIPSRTLKRPIILTPIRLNQNNTPCPL